MVDHEYLFRNINVGWPGSVRDAHVFANSSLFADASAKRILQGDNCTILGCIVPPLLIADSAYPLLPWLLKPVISHSHLDRKTSITAFLVPGLCLRMPLEVEG